MFDRNARGHFRRAEDEIGFPVAINIAGGEAHPAVPVFRVDSKSFDAAVRLVHQQFEGRWILQPPVGAEGGDGEVDATVAVEIPGGDVHGAGKGFKEHFVELEVAVVAHHADAVSWFQWAAAEFEVVSAALDYVGASVAIPIGEEATVVAPT